MNGLSVKAASNLSLGRTLRQKLWPFRWWDSGSSGEEVQGIYNEVYQQNKLPGPPLYGSEWMEALDREICTSLEEWMWQRQGTARPEEDQRGATVSIIWPSCQAESPHQTQGRTEDPHNQALKEAREAHQRALEPNPIEPPAADSPAVLAVAPSVLENMSAAPIATPATSKEESIAHVTISTASADEPDNPPTPSKTTGNARSPTESEYLRWVKVHLSHMAASVGSIPCNLGDLRWCCCNCSSSQHKKASHLLEEEQQALRLLFSSASSRSSPEPVPKRRKTQEPNQRCHLWDSWR